MSAASHIRATNQRIGIILMKEVLVGSLLMIDEYKGYNRVEMKIKRAVTNHAVRYVSW